MSSAYTIEVNQDTFQREVLERSKSVPVVVDFWAEWCGPCHQLGPVLERETNSRNGAVYLAKVDIDRSPILAQKYRVSSIPSVQAFRDGQPVAQFVGAIPPVQVKQFYDKLVPSAAVEVVRRGQTLFNEGKVAEAESVLKEAILLDAQYDMAKVVLVGVYLEQGKAIEAKDLITQIKPGSSDRASAEALLFRSEIAADATKKDPREQLDAIEDDPGNLALRWSVAAAFLLQEEFEDALREFLEIVKRDRKFRDDGARKAMLAIFAMLGPDDELTHLFRRRLSMSI